MKKKKNTLLWRIIPPNGGQESYLFGTMHVRDERAFEGLPKALEALEKCAVFATEFDFQDVDPAAIEAALTLPEGVTLSSVLVPNALKNLDFFCQKQLKTSSEIFENRHPMAVSTIVTQAMLAEDMPLSLDETLWSKAKELGKTCTGVETFEEQIAVIGKIPLEAHAKNLNNLLKNVSGFKKHLKKMAEAYRKADIQQLYRFAQKDTKGMRKVLLYHRNTIMAERMEELMHENSLFCAVGAGHLAGEKGVLKLLKKRGYKVKPI